MNVGKIIYGLRTHKDIRQQELADKAKTTRQLIHKVETNPDYCPSHHTMSNIAEALECPLPLIYMWAMESTDCKITYQRDNFIAMQSGIMAMLDLIYNKPQPS